MADLFSKIFYIFTDLHQQASLVSPPPTKGSTLNDFVTPIPPLQLSRPHSGALIPELVAVGASLNIAQELSEIHANSCSQLASEYEEIYRNACLEVSFPTLPTERRTAEEQSRFFRRLQKIRRHYDRTVASWSADLVQSIANRGSIKCTGKLDTSHRQEFDPDNIQKLKAFFEIKPKPSRADKVYLAKACNMTVKQINIWFQNRRARVKKTLRSDICVQQLHSDEAPRASTEGREVQGNVSDSETVVEEDGSDPLVRCCSRSSSVTLVDEDEHSTEFKVTSPSFAFPTKYSPKLKDKAFPCVYGDSRFPEPVWRRLYSALAPAQTQHSISDIVGSMEKLSLGPDDRVPDTTLEGRVDSQCRATTNQCKASISWLKPFTVRPPLAPLPSLLRSVSRKTTCPGSNAHHDRTLSFRPPSVDNTAASRASETPEQSRVNACEDAPSVLKLHPDPGQSESVQDRESAIIESVSQHLFTPPRNPLPLQPYSGDQEVINFITASLFPCPLLPDGDFIGASLSDDVSWNLALMFPSSINLTESLV